MAIFGGNDKSNNGWLCVIIIVLIVLLIIYMYAYYGCDTLLPNFLKKENVGGFIGNPDIGVTAVSMAEQRL